MVLQFNCSDKVYTPLNGPTGCSYSLYYGNNYFSNYFILFFCVIYTLIGEVILNRQ